MGALVLILMLLVASAQATKQEAAREIEQRVEEAEAAIDSMKSTFNKELNEGQIELEKERLKLQHFEEHIRELLAELDELKQTLELAEQEVQQDEDSKAKLAQELSELEKQLAEATTEWQKKLDKPEGDKPVFAIIPYQGTNGTHRRPIYVECTAQGVTLQPEGVVIPLADLQPPYGPGNPLDAALRTIRAEFPPSNGAVTSTAYPLLVVRPSGIKSYVMARAAMRGWDDQFGYELIDEELELAFPEPTPGLKSKVVSSIDLARQRQAALVMAMPQRFRGMDLADNFEGEWRSDGAGGGNLGFGDGDGSSSGTLDGGYAGASGAGEGDAASQAGSYRGGFQNSTGGQFGGPAGDMSAAQSTLAAQPGSAAGGFALGDSAADSGSNTTADWSSPADDAAFGGSGSAADSMLAADKTSRNGPISAMQLRPSDGLGNGAAASSDGMLAGTNSSASDQANYYGEGGTPGSSNSQAQSDRSSAGSQSANNLGGAPGGAQGGSTPIANSAGQMSANQTNADPGTQGGSQAPPASGQAPSVAMNNSLNQGSSRRESAAPVAKARGRNWAWSQGPPTETPVVRSIRVQCLSDRWVILPDAGSNKQPESILFDGSPQARAEQLAKLVSDRVSSWGLALTGGHWKPMLSVEVAPDAEWRFVQLQQLLDGSGLDVQRRGGASTR